jgi:acetyl-CoA synthetase
MATTYPPSKEMAQNAHVDAAKYDEMYAASVKDPTAFWDAHGKRIDWIKPYSKVKDVTYDYGKVDINWYSDGTLNVSANCIDRHLATRGDQTAIIFEPR